MKNNLKLLSSFIILSTLMVLFAFSVPAWGCGSGCRGCYPSCGPCQACECSVCVNTCLSSQCKTCVNGQCQSTCNSSLCQICVNGQCQSACNSSLCQICVNGVCQSSCDPISETCENGQCVPQLPRIIYTYDQVGNRISMTDPAGTTSYTYDYLHRLISVTNPDNKTISYQYDASGNRTQLTDPASNITAYTYDGDNRLVTVVQGTASTTYQYDSLGKVKRADLPNGTYTQYTYNSQRNWLVSLVNKNSSGTVLSSYSYTYDNVGNRLTVTEQDGSVVTYGYDNIYQLTSETRTGTNAYNITYQYDSAGNRTQMVKNGATTSYTYNSNNQLLTETSGGTTVTYAYDLNGNLLSKTASGNTTSYTWDWNNHLLSVTEPAGTTVYEYDGDGTRIIKTQAAVMTKYINDVALGLVQVLMETDNTGVVQAIYNYGNDLISMNRAGTNSYYNYDGLGSTRQLTNSSGVVTKSYTYDSWGNLIASSGSVVNTYGFTGEQQFGEADNLVFLRARYYDPRVGRFISRDPLLSIEYYARRGMDLRKLKAWSTVKPRWLNPYIYCLNNPVNLIDPTGGCSKTPDIPPGLIGEIPAWIIEAGIIKTIADALGAACAGQECKKGNDLFKDPSYYWGVCISIADKVGLPPGTIGDTGALVDACADSCMNIIKSDDYKCNCL